MQCPRMSWNSTTTTKIVRTCPQMYARARRTVDIHGIAVTERITFKVSSKIWLMALALEISIGCKLAQLDAACEAEEKLGKMSTIVLLAVALSMRMEFTQTIPGKSTILEKIHVRRALPNRCTPLVDIADLHPLFLYLSLQFSGRFLRVLRASK